MKAVIIAAGMGSRIWNETDNTPKTLLPYGEGSILSTIMSNFNKVGIREFVVVVGYQSEFIKRYLKDNSYFNMDVEFIENLRWEEGNGISVLAAEPAVKGDDFILSMSDHLVSTNALDRIVNYDSNKNLLLVDPRIDEIYDIDDATKVAFENTQIVDIGKEIDSYNGVDCGIFRLNEGYFSAMRKALKKEQDSISAAIKMLINGRDIEAVFMNHPDNWIDVDTLEAYQYSLDNRHLYS